MTVTENTPPAGEANLPSRRMQVPASAANPLASACHTVGEIAVFGVGVIRELPLAIGLYPAEVIRQSAVLIRSSALVIWFMMFAIGAETGLQGHYVLAQVGASAYTAVFNAVGNLMADNTSMWGWILAAKVGCGYVAELGAMRITDEVDALDVMGLRSRPYLAGSRLWAMFIAGPFIYLAGLGCGFVGCWVSSQLMLDSTSPGQYWSIFWAFQTPVDALYSFIWAMLLGAVIVIVGCFYGYNASGGPVGVGKATAKSMVVNMIIVSACAAILFQLFFGTNLQTPIAN